MAFIPSGFSTAISVKLLLLKKRLFVTQTILFLKAPPYIFPIIQTSSHPNKNSMAGLAASAFPIHALCTKQVSMWGSFGNL